MFAIAEFGSSTRGTRDQLSDRDLLIVSERGTGRKISNRYRSLGYSVTLLSPKQLYFMQSRGSLFVQHLKHESHILVDFNSEFRSWLDRSQLVSPSPGEIQRCISTVEYIGTWPNDSRLTGWRADFLYCVSRDLLIKYLATQGHLAFGIDDLESELTQQFSNQFKDLRQLRRLRESKASYRSGLTVPEYSHSAVEAWLEQIAPVFNLNLPRNKLITAEELISCLKNRSFVSSYELLRSVEASYHILRSYDYFHPDHELLVNYIKNPNGYGSSQSRNASIMLSYLEDMSRVITTNGLHKGLKLFGDKALVELN